MRSFDVLIVGGGPAGSSLAWALKDTGLKVGILDKKTFPRDKVCAGWVTPAVLRELEIDLDDYALTRVLQPITGFRVGQIGGKQVDSSYATEPVSYGIRRFEFDEYLLYRSNAELIIGELFKTLEKLESGWLVNGRIATRLLVGAGGHACPVTRATGARPTLEDQVVLAQEIEFQMTPEQLAECGINPQMPELFFTPDLAGYGWVFRKGDYLNIGLGREDKQGLPQHVEAFCRYLKKQGKIPRDTPEKWHGHAYTLYPHARRNLVKDNVLFVGDAAGLAYPQSGEGIRPAVESALLAAKAIHYCNGDYGAGCLAMYDDLITERFGPRQPKQDLVDRLPFVARQFLAGMLMRTAWFNRKVVLNRWFLHLHQAPLKLMD